MTPSDYTLLLIVGALVFAVIAGAVGACLTCGDERAAACEEIRRLTARVNQLEAARARARALACDLRGDLPYALGRDRDLVAAGEALDRELDIPGEADCVR
jgi:hypothetical protein